MSSYYISKTVHYSFEKALEKASSVLADNGFGILSTIDVKTILKKKINKDIPPYTILGACNPHFASQALEIEPFIGVMLPCNVIVREDENSQVIVAAVDPIASMQAINNEELGKIASQVRDILAKVIEEI